jgi:hypothetical protein
MNWIRGIEKAPTECNQTHAGLYGRQQLSLTGSSLPVRRITINL